VAALAVWAAGFGWASAQLEMPAQIGSSYNLVAFTDQPAPGSELPGFQDRYRVLGVPAIGNGGDVAFSGDFSNPTQETFGEAVWAGRPGALARVTDTSTPAPGAEGLFSSFGAVAINALGQVAFIATALGETEEFGIWDVGPLGLAFGLSGGHAETLGPVVFNKSRAVALKIKFPGATMSVLINGILGFADPVLQDGDFAPGFQGEKILEIIGNPVDPASAGDRVDLNDTGELAFKAIVGDTSAETSFGVIYSGMPEDLKPIAVEGDPAPGIEDTVYSVLDGHPSLSSNGFVAFVSQIVPSSPLLLGVTAPSAIFATGPDAGLRPIVREGDEVPGAPGVVFGAFSNPCVNSAGDVVFSAEIVYPGGGTRPSIWVKRMTGGPVLLAASGVNFGTPFGVLEAESVDFVGAGGFNDLNQAIFRAKFTDDADAGIYVADTRPGAPVITVISPATPTEQVTKGKQIFVTGTAFDETGIAKVEYTVTAIQKAGKRKKGRPARHVSPTRRAIGTANWQFLIPLVLGRNRVSVVATDSVGNVTECEFTVIRYECGK